VDTATTRQYGGTGLGLAISRQLASLMGGEIGAYSAPGNGSTFWFSIALETQPGDVVEQPLPGFEKLASFAGTRVMTVDNRMANASMLQKLLEKWGFKAEGFTDPRPAFDRLLAAARTDEPFKLILIDKHMPENGGNELITRLRQEPALQNLPCIVLASVRHRTEAGALVASDKCAAMIAKPIKRILLLNTLLKVLGQVGSQEEATTHPPSPDALADRRQLRLLVVEDNIVNQKVATSMLRQIGLEQVDIAGNGMRAVEAVGSNDYDLILMDCQMPVMDGYEAARALRASGLTIPIIALTANALATDRALCLEAGMSDYLSKPIKKTLLQEMLERWLPH
jgi:CheY-like chemotaxis protein